MRGDRRLATATGCPDRRLASSRSSPVWAPSGHRIRELYRLRSPRRDEFGDQMTRPVVHPGARAPSRCPSPGLRLAILAGRAASTLGSGQFGRAVGRRPRWDACAAGVGSPGERCGCRYPAAGGLAGGQRAVGHGCCRRSAARGGSGVFRRYGSGHGRRRTGECGGEPGVRDRGAGGRGGESEDPLVRVVA
jgi:hypothetical protein